ncbi:unnamed protein product [Prorocentrum cordatum]|uniref:Uncharacterized protein n=1 Tax=Prorocentrum cordatum TaxID=2364126 RepID=A0ABN9T2M5_9DINO|nr:unnamed protein product [Polarella glacialis]
MDMHAARELKERDHAARSSTRSSAQHTAHIKGPAHGVHDAPNLLRDPCTMLQARPCGNVQAVQSVACLTPLTSSAQTTMPRPEKEPRSKILTLAPMRLRCIRKEKEKEEEDEAGQGSPVSRATPPYDTDECLQSHTEFVRGAISQGGALPFQDSC